MYGQNSVFQFKITLQEIKPVIWRRIQIPTNYTFWDFHVAIQDSMGWFDCHLHRFEIKPPRAHKSIEIGIPFEDDDLYDFETIAGWETKVDKYFTKIGNTALYIYDFGDNWHHNILFEGIIIREKGYKYPKCIDGKRLAPPENCGGDIGYYDFLEAVSNPEHEEHDRMIEWNNGEFNPENFSKENVKFTNPKARLKRVLQNC